MNLIWRNLKRIKTYKTYFWGILLQDSFFVKKIEQNSSYTKYILVTDYGHPMKV